MLHEGEDSKIARNRLEAIVDGIFAFAMTLLVTGLVIPRFSKAEAEINLPLRIAEMHSEFISFLVAFFVLASFWQTHNRHFHHVRSVDAGIMRITLFILAGVVLIPFTTNVSGDYSHVRLAVDLFHVNMFALGLCFFIHWWYLIRHPALTSPAIAPDYAAKGLCLSLVTPGVSALGFACAFISPSWSMATYLLIIPGSAIVQRYFR